MEKKNPRENLGNWAGGFYTIANTGMTFKSVIDTGLVEHKLDVSSIAHDPLALGIGTTFLATSVMLAKAGDNNKWTGIALGIATLGNVAFTAYTVMHGHDVSSTLGGVCITAASAYGTYQAYKREKQAGEETAKNPPQRPEKNKIASFFADNIRDMTEKCPFLVFGITEIVSNTAICLGALGVKDYTLAAIAALWGAGGSCMAFALPKVDEKKLQPA